MKHSILLSLGLALLLSAAPLSAQAYVGPGAGLSLVGAAIGLLLAIVTALGFVLLWPFRRALKRRRAQPTAGLEDSARPADRQRAEPRMTNRT